MNRTMCTVPEIIATQLGCILDAVMPAARLREDLGADSLDEIEVTIAIADEYGIEISDVDWLAALEAGRVQDIADLVERHIAVPATTEPDHVDR